MTIRNAAYALAFAALSLSMPLVAHGAAYRFDFNASNFISEYGNPVPADPVHGSITFQAASLGAEVEAILAVDLEINGHVYQVSEVGGYRFGTGYLFGGLLNDVNSIVSKTNDFWVQNQTGHEDLVYAIDTPVVDFWTSQKIEITITAVPEPSTAALCLVGLAGVAALRGRRRLSKTR